MEVAPKRTASQCLTVPERTVIPKKMKRSSVPALASLASLAGEDCGVGGTKHALLTRAKLRAARHDPKGLLDLSGPTTNALDRTKELELLKSAGYEFSPKVKKTFSDRLHEAQLRLDLGMGGHSMNDTLLFGGKVLSLPLPGSLA